MKCPKCENPNTVVKDSRNLASTRRRRRECDKCGHRFTTTEVEGIHRSDSLTLIVPDVVKRDKESVPFERNKLSASIHRACSRRKIANEDIEQLLEVICEKVFKSDSLRVEVTEIIDWTVSGLGEIDNMAAMRYAIQYLDFKSPEDFQEYYVKLQG